MQIKYIDLDFIDDNLKLILWGLEQDTGLDFTITSLYRIGDKGVHGQLPLRGIDIRMRDSKIGKDLENRVNHFWAYDPDRPCKKCAILHGVGSNMHLHLQVHPNTERKS